MNIINKLKIWFIPCEENVYKPRFLADKTLLYSVVGLIFLKIIAVSFVVYIPKTVFFADLTKMAIIDLTNQERQIAGVGQLKENAELNFAAAQKAQDMLNNDYFSHQSPQGVSPWYWSKKVGYNYKIAGENLAIGFVDSEEVLTAWEDSPSHRENLLNPKFQEIGIAVAKGEFQGSEATIVVQLLGAPNYSQAKTAAKTIVPTTVKKIQIQSAETKPSQTTDNETVEKTTEQEEEKIVAIKGENVAIENSTQINNISNLSENKEKDGFDKFVEFMTFRYADIVQKIIFYTLLAITIALILNVFIKIGRQDKRLIAKTAVFIALLGLFVLSDQEVIIQLIPHNLLI